jgi:hypothetical protein
MENNNEYITVNQETAEPIAWYAQKKYFYLIILSLIAAGAIAVYFIMNQPQDLRPIVVNLRPKFTAQVQPATTSSISQQASTPSSSTSPKVTAVPKTATQSTKAGGSSVGSTTVKNDNLATPVIKEERLVYTNTQYGFSLSFPPTWKGYSVTNETVPGTAAVLNFGFAQQKSIFMIVAYTRAMWDRSKHDDLTYYLGANNSYAFIYNPAQGGADQVMSARLAELKSILATFLSK